MTDTSPSIGKRTSQTRTRNPSRLNALTHNAIILVAALLLLALGWFFTERMRLTITRSVIVGYQNTEMEIVRGVARSIQSYVVLRLASDERPTIPIQLIEGEIFRLFVDPVKLLQSGDAWIYAPDHVVYDESSDFPDTYRGKSMAEIFAIQKRAGASHFEEMTDAVMHARDGMGWYLWLPEKGPEIAAWTAAHVEPFTWTIGLSTPLKEILDSTGASGQIRSSREIMTAVTILTVALLAIWGFAELRRSRAELILREQKDLSISLGPLLPLDESLRLCLETVTRLVQRANVAIYLAQDDGRHFTLRRESCIAGGCPAFPPAWEMDFPSSGRFPRMSAIDRAIPSASPHGTPVTVAPSTGETGIVGCVAMTRCSQWRSSRYQRHVLEAVAMVLGSALGRLRMEESLRESERRFRSVVDTAADAIVTVTPEGRIEFWNAAAERLLGRSCKAAQGTSLSDFIATEPASAVGDGQGGERTVGIRPDGARFPVGISRALWEARDGTYATYVIRDMSEHERAEKERWELEQKVQRTHRMESIGVLAGGVAHDLSNALTPIVGYADLMIADAPADSPLKDSLTELYRSARHAGSIVQDLLTLGKRGTYEMAPIGLNSIVQQYLASPSFGEAKQKARGVSVRADLAPTLSPFLGSATHVTTMLRNLLLNAFEAMPDGGEVVIATSNRSLESAVFGYEPIEAGNYVVLEVEDSGDAISAQDIERIFEPFFAKKALGRSASGLGLAVVYSIAHDHKARLDVAASPAGGTCFRIWFPASDEKPIPRLAPTGELRGVETILLVDDQPDVRTVASRLLQRLGYSVQTAPHGHAAIAYLQTHKADLVVLDMIMEDDFDGLDCLKGILRIRPGQKTIIVSGFAETDRVREALRLGAGTFVSKPYSAKELALAIRQVLGDRADTH